GESAHRGTVPEGMARVLPPQHRTPRRPGLHLQRHLLLHRLAGLRRTSRPRPGADGTERGVTAAVPGRVRADRLRGADRSAPSPADAAVFPGGGGLPADQQGVEPAVLAVAGAAGGAGVAAPADPAGLDDDRRAGVGAAYVLLPRHR